jgi:hypothetical protein
VRQDLRRGKRRPGDALGGDAERPRRRSDPRHGPARSRKPVTEGLRRGRALLPTADRRPPSRPATAPNGFRERPRYRRGGRAPAPSRPVGERGTETDVSSRRLLLDRVPRVRARRRRTRSGAASAAARARDAAHNRPRAIAAGGELPLGAQRRGDGARPEASTRVWSDPGERRSVRRSSR